MKTEMIEQRLQDIKNEIHSLDSLRDAHDDTNIHIIEEQQDILYHERQELTFLLESCFDNIIGLVPRFAWPDKPFIGINGNIIGHDLNILHTNDNLTSISLGSIGESYYLLGWYGIAIAAFQGLLMALLDKFSLYKNYILSVIYFFISFEIVLISSYSILIPKIVKIILIYIILILVFEKFFVRKRYLT
jgi:hypothetical protein